MVVLVVAAFAVTVLIGVVRGAGDTGEEIAASRETPAATVDAATLYVHVAGAVSAPGLYALPTGARAVDAIAAAGGFAEGAERGAVNLARPVSDGEQLVVPLVGDASVGATGGGAAAVGADGVIDLNAADVAALDTLPRIGPALAERIVAWREENGRFTSVDDLLAVSGIGAKLLDGVRDRVRV